MLRAMVLTMVLAIALGAGSAFANDDQCTAYASEAMQAAIFNRDLGCGFEGPRWSLDEGLHYGYCIDRKQNSAYQDALYEQDERAAALQDCRAQVSASGGNDEVRPDIIVGGWEGLFCGAPATFEIEQGDGADFTGHIVIRDTGEIDEIQIRQYDDFSIRILRSVSNLGGRRQQVRTGAPSISFDGGVPVASFSTNRGTGPGCNNGATTDLRISYY